MAADPRATARIKKRKEEKLSLNKPKYKRGDNFDNTSGSSRAAAIADSSLFKPKTDKPKKPTYNTKDEYKPSSSKASDKKASNEISDDEMKSINRQIKAKIKANKASDSKVEITDKEIEDIAKRQLVQALFPRLILRVRSADWYLERMQSSVLSVVLLPERCWVMMRSLVVSAV